MPPVRRNATFVAAFVTVVASVSPCTGCASSGTADATGAVASSASDPGATTEAADAGETGETGQAVEVDGSTSVPSVPSGGVDDVRNALGGRDACALYEQLEAVAFDEEQPEEFADQLTQIASVMDDAVDLVDPELHDDWALMADGAREMARQLRSHPDDRKKAAAVLSRSELTSASAHIDEWMDEHCA